MEFRDAVQLRKMTRSFRTEAIDDDLVERLLQAALRSPSAGFAQGVDLLVLTQIAERTRFWELISEPEWLADPARSSGLVAAPVIVIPIGNPNAYVDRYAGTDKRGSAFAGLGPDSWPVPYWTVDAAFVAMSLLLGVTDAGLGALFFHLQAQEHRLLEGFAIPPHHTPIGAIAIGHSQDPATVASTTRRPRRTHSEIIHRERW